MPLRRGALLILTVTLALDVSIAQVVKHAWIDWYVLTPANNPRAPSPIYHHGLRPMMDVMHRERMQRYRLATNSLGMVDGEPRAVDPMAGGCRVLIIGDSFTEGYGVGWDGSFVNVLAERWRDYGVEVLNAGVIGYSPSIYYRKVRHLIEDVRLQFDALIVAIDISDIRDEWVKFDIDERERVAGITSTLATTTMRPATTIDRIVFAAVDNSLTAHLIHRAMWVSGLWPSDQIEGAADAPSTIRPPHRPPLLLPLGALSVPFTRTDTVGRVSRTYVARYGYWSLNHADWLSYGRDGLQVAAERMDRLVLLLRQHKIPITVSVHPWQTNLTAGDLDSVQVTFWREWARTRGAGFVNLFPVFFNAGPDVINSHFIDGDFHWNRRGHDLVAEAIARQYDPRTACHLSQLSNGKPPVP